MANLVIPRREIWTQQPQGAEGIDWSNPITNGIASVLNPASGLRDHITGELWTPFGATPKPGVGPKGRLFDSTPAFGGYALISSRNLATPAQTHLFFVEYVTKSESFSGLFGSASANGSSPSLILQDLGSSAFGVYPGSPGSLPSGSAFGPSVILISGDANNSDGYKDGVAFLTGAPAVVPQATASLRVFGECAMNPSYSTKGRAYLSISWTRRLTASEKLAVSENPWQIFRPRRRISFFDMGAGGSVNASASGALSAVSVTAPSASASGSASATGACAAITLSAPTATASAGGSASASGSFASLTIAAPNAAATASGIGSGALAALSITPATATATATTSATASGAFAAISLSAPNATATGTTAGNAIATATPAQITISPATASAIGSAVASGAFAALSITPPTATATSAGDAHAIAAFAALSINPTTGAAYGSAIATGSLPIISLSAVTGTASNGVDIDQQYPLAGLSQSRPLAGLSQNYPLGN